MEVPRGNTNAVKDFSTSTAKQAFKSRDRHTFLYYMQGNVTQSIAYVNVKRAAIISLNSYEIFLSVIYMMKQNLFNYIKIITILLKNVYPSNFHALEGSVYAKDGGREGGKKRRQGGNKFLSVVFPP